MLRNVFLEYFLNSYLKSCLHNIRCSKILSSHSRSLIINSVKFSCFLGLHFISSTRSSAWSNYPTFACPATNEFHLPCGDVTKLQHVEHLLGVSEATTLGVHVNKRRPSVHVGLELVPVEEAMCLLAMRKQPHDAPRGGGAEHNEKTRYDSGEGLDMWLLERGSREGT